ncbi:hypothetical protein CSUI_010654 [Cystoisospora suis]|uniref:Transmembrane protein n=1 Tax=Cystoisospora suis TaxID=483139 RepID=A0A2C6KGC8_9APIC|nr:hypothetical protein CSUI_010654 [Cystoisospora suis]
MNPLSFVLLGLFLTVCDISQCSLFVSTESPAPGHQDDVDLITSSEATVQPHQPGTSPVPGEGLAEGEPGAGRGGGGKLSRLFRRRSGPQKTPAAPASSDLPSRREGSSRRNARRRLASQLQGLGESARKWFRSWGRSGRGRRASAGRKGRPTPGDVAFFLQDLHTTVAAVRLASVSLNNRSAAGAGPEEIDLLMNALEAKRDYLKYLLGQAEEMRQLHPESSIDIDTLSDFAKTALQESAQV